MQPNAKLTASQTVFLTEDRKTAVKEGDKSARFLLVRAGREIVRSEAEKYEGALELIGAEVESETVEKAHKKKGKKEGE